MGSAYHVLQTFISGPVGSNHYHYDGGFLPVLLSPSKNLVRFLKLTDTIPLARGRASQSRGRHGSLSVLMSLDLEGGESIVLAGSQ